MRCFTDSFESFCLTMEERFKEYLLILFEQIEFEQVKMWERRILCFHSPVDMRICDHSVEMMFKARRVFFSDELCHGKSVRIRWMTIWTSQHCDQWPIHSRQITTVCSNIFSGNCWLKTRSLTIFANEIHRLYCHFCQSSSKIEDAKFVERSIFSQIGIDSVSMVRAKTRNGDRWSRELVHWLIFFI